MSLGLGADLLLGWPGLAAVVAVFCAGLIQGSTGFGFNMLAAPLLAIIDPVFVPGPMLVMAGIVCIGAAIRDRRDIQRSDLIFALGGRLLSALAAAFLVGVLSPALFSAVFGLAVLLAVVLSMVGLTIRTTPVNLFGAGVISGFMGTLTSIGAPPMALVYQNAEPARMRATLNAYFCLGAIISIVALTMVGSFGRPDLSLGLIMTPFALLGYVGSGWAKRFMTKSRVKPMVIGISLASAFVLLARAFG